MSVLHGHRVRPKDAAILRPEIAPQEGTIPGRDLVVGDVIDFLGRRYEIDHFMPYLGQLRGVLGEGARVAWSGDWGMTIGPNAAIRIVPRPAAAMPGESL
ncbi:hypothetical protein [Sphaerisporangium sp. TRM90804]|uniref:hypothetical protein n=1 Tax=Sphaerisporangium sp. TRM90804 TaxID=3031113 RepID=UPI00244C1021|nr:hypothetical protein [Sphaerisporangium sp. TRM90804]MDH2425731.1 hypothetical protein [Sphaerisporangium sp. TRM90804]